jgi:hypothetical protein
VQEELKRLPKDKLVFFVVATYGEGEPTDNAQEAYRMYKEEEHEPGCLRSRAYWRQWGRGGERGKMAHGDERERDGCRWHGHRRTCMHQEAW